MVAKVVYSEINVGKDERLVYLLQLSLRCENLTVNAYLEHNTYEDVELEEDMTPPESF